MGKEGIVCGFVRYGTLAEANATRLRVGSWTRLCSVRQILIEANAVAEWVGYFNRQTVIKRLLAARSHVAVAA